MAVLPFRNNSRDSSNSYFINGLAESILNNLANIQGFAVRSRTSVEKYRETNLSLPEIAKALGVNYIVEGSGQKYGNEVALNIQLVKADSDKPLLSKQYIRKIEKVGDFIALQREIAYQLAAEIESTVKPNDINWYKSIKTRNFVALNNYFQGIELHHQAELSKENTIALESKAMEKFRKAIEADPNFAWPMLQMGWIYYIFYSRRDMDPQFLDSAFFFARKAISMDSTYPGGYGLLGFLYQHTGENKKALEAQQLTLKYSVKRARTFRWWLQAVKFNLF